MFAPVRKSVHNNNSSNISSSVTHKSKNKRSRAEHVINKNVPNLEFGARIAEMLRPVVIAKLTEALNQQMEAINNLRFEITRKMQENLEKSESKRVECIVCSKMLNKRGIQQHCSRYVYCVLCGTFETVGRESCRSIAFIKNLTSIALI